MTMTGECRRASIFEELIQDCAVQNLSLGLISKTMSRKAI